MRTNKISQFVNRAIYSSPESGPSPFSSAGGATTGNEGNNNNAFSSFRQGSNPLQGGENPFEVIQRKREGNSSPQGNPNGLPSGTTPPSANPRTQGGDSTTPPSPRRASPLDKYKQSADNSTNSGEPKPTPQSPPQPQAQPQPQFDPFSLKSEQYQELMRNNNFAQGLTQETWEKIQGGDIQELQNIINQAVLQGSSLAAHMSTQVAARGVNHHLDQFSNTKLKDTLNDYSFQQQTRTSGDDVLNHPHIQPLVESKVNEFRQNYPEATPQEIMEATRMHFEDMIESFRSSNSQNNSSQSKPKNSIGGFFGY